MVSGDARSCARLSEPAAPETGSSPIAKITIATNLADVEELWRRAEVEMIASPYQTFGWYSAWLATVGARRHHEPIIVVAYDERGHPIAILPLVKRRAWRGLVLCEFAGGRHSNANFGLFAPSLSGFIDARTMRWILHDTNRQVGRIDAFCFVNMPFHWRGQESWVSKAGGQPSPSSLHATTIARTFEEWRAAWLSPSRTKKLRQKLHYLSRIGPTRLVEGFSQIEVERILAAFYKHKSQRFAQLGLDDPFAEADIKDFIRTAAARSPGDRPGAAIELFALEVNGNIVSTLGAAITGQTCSAMFLSFDDDASVRAASPGELLVAQVIQRLCERGFSHFDLGIGEAPYKDRYCADVVPLHDFFFGTTFSGILIANALRASTSVKRILKKLGYSRTIAVMMTRLRSFFAFW